MAYIRTHEAKQRSRGKVVKRYEVVYRAMVGTDDGRVVSRLRQESHPTREAAEARAAELNAHRHSHTTDPAEQRKRGERGFVDWSIDWLASQRVKVANGQLNRRAAPQPQTPHRVLRRGLSGSENRDAVLAVLTANARAG